MPGGSKKSRFMQRCVADVSGQGKEVGSAFAICTAQSQKSGYSEPGSVKQTGKGKAREKFFKGQPDMKSKSAAYEKAVKPRRKEESMREIFDRIEEARITRMGPSDARKLQVYDFGSRVRNFAGDLAMRTISRGEPEEEIVSSSPQVKRSLKSALDALDKLSRAIFDTEKALDISPSIRGQLASEGLDEAITGAGIRVTLERAIEKARSYANSVVKSRFTRDMADEFRQDLESFAKDLEEIAGAMTEACDDPGKKRRSKGRGRGLAVGRGRGPLGNPEGDR